MSETVYRCAKCDAYWPPDKTECVFCHSTERRVSALAQPISPPIAPYRPASAERSQGVYITGIDLPWGEVFAVAVKFVLVLALFQIVGGAIIYLLLR